MTEPLVIVETQERVATVTLNRPAALNALSTQMRIALVQAFRQLREDPRVRVVIVTGAGRAFCAGMDLKELGGGPAEASGLDNCRDGLELDEVMAGFPGPLIAAVNGYAIAGGLELALNCDLIVAASSASFADTHARVGMLPGWGLSQRLPRLIGPARAKEMCLTGDFIDASQACAWGLVNRVVELPELMPTCRVLAEKMVRCAEGTLEGYKRLIDDGLCMPLPEALRHERNFAQEFGTKVSAASIASRRDALLETKRGR